MSFICTVNAQGQTEEAENTIIAVPDSSDLKTIDELLVEEEVADGVFVMQKSPTTAVLLSFALPGIGQLYNEDYWKAPIFIGASGVLIYLIVDNHSSYVDAEELWQSSKSDGGNSSLTNLYYTRKEYYRDNRDLSAFYLLGVYVVAAVDAYVGAHMYDFNVDDEFSVGIYPAIGPESAGIGFRISF